MATRRPTSLLVTLTLITAASTGLAAVSADSASTPAPRGPKMRPLSEREQVIHAMNRLALGATPGEVERVQKIGWKAWVEQQLQPDSLADTKIEEQVARDYPSLKMTLDQVFEGYQVKGPAPTTPEERKKRNQESNRLRSRLETELVESVMLRAVYSERRFKEVMVEFWRNHLAIDVNKVQYQANNYEEQVIRKHVFSRFEDLLLASAKHPAMLIYLDNFVSRAGGLNENYAREIMELHTLGVDNGYTQRDVRELARVLTGWTCGNRRAARDSEGQKQYGFIYNESMHDHKPAEVIGIVLEGKDGLADGEQIITDLANHPRTARFISFKLCRYLVSDQPSPELVDKITKVFLSTGGDLRKVYQAIVMSEEFMSPENYKAKFKTPFEYAVSALRATGAQITSMTALRRELKLMGQAVYECSDPTGYYDQAEAWLDPGVMVYRWNFAIQLVSDKIRGIKIDSAAFEPWQRLPQGDKMQRVVDVILGGRVDQKTRDSLARLVDIRGQIALALGSSSFQAQ